MIEKVSGSRAWGRSFRSKDGSVRRFVSTFWIVSRSLISYSIMLLTFNATQFPALIAALNAVTIEKSGV